MAATSYVAVDRPSGLRNDGEPCAHRGAMRESERERKRSCVRERKKRKRERETPTMKEASAPLAIPSSHAQKAPQQLVLHVAFVGRASCARHDAAEQRVAHVGVLERHAR